LKNWLKNGGRTGQLLRGIFGKASISLIKLDESEELFIIMKAIIAV
jgi:hypothetical protein